MPTITVHSTQHDRPFAPSRAARAPEPDPPRRGPAPRALRFAPAELPAGVVVVRERKDEPLVFVLAGMLAGDAWLFRVSNGFCVSSVRTSVFCVNSVRRADGIDRTLSYESRGSEVLVRCESSPPVGRASCPSSEGSAA